MGAKAQALDFATEAAAIHKHISAGEQEFRLAARELISVRDRLRHGQWLPWLDANGIARRTAQRLIDEYHHPDKADKRREEQASRNHAAAKNATSGAFEGNVIEFPSSDDAPIEAEIDGEDPENYRTAYLLRAEQAIRFAAYSGPINSETIAVARRVATAWSKLADTLERTL